MAARVRAIVYIPCFLFTANRPFHHARNSSPVPLSLAQSRLIATAINLVLGTLAGYFLARKRFIGRELLDTILVLPMCCRPP